ncbi:MAG TPA: hypothetical protein VFL97_09810 [Nitrococcus sp.]|nr:hypothetical protein [Nitrococcus sp.]
MRDLETRDVTLVPGDLCEPLAGDLLEAEFLPVLTAADPGLSIPYVWQGLVPTVALYRIQIAPRISGMLRVNKKVLQELVSVELIWLYELRFGVAPIDKSGVSGPIFECVEMLSIPD